MTATFETDGSDYWSAGFVKMTAAGDYCEWSITLTQAQADELNDGCTIFLYKAGPFSGQTGGAQLTINGEPIRYQVYGTVTGAANPSLTTGSGSSSDAARFDDSLASFPAGTSNFKSGTNTFRIYNRRASGTQGEIHIDALSIDPTTYGLAYTTTYPNGGTPTAFFTGHANPEASPEPGNPKWLFKAEDATLGFAYDVTPSVTVTRVGYELYDVTVSWASSGGPSPTGECEIDWTASGGTDIGPTVMSGSSVTFSNVDIGPTSTYPSSLARAFLNYFGDANTVSHYVEFNFPAEPPLPTMSYSTSSPTTGQTVTFTNTTSGSFTPQMAISGEISFGSFKTRYTWVTPGTKTVTLRLNGGTNGDYSATSPGGTVSGTITSQSRTNEYTFTVSGSAITGVKFDATPNPTWLTNSTRLTVKHDDGSALASYEIPNVYFGIPNPPSTDPLGETPEAEIFGDVGDAQYELYYAWDYTPSNYVSGNPGTPDYVFLEVATYQVYLEVTYPGRSDSFEYTGSVEVLEGPPDFTQPDPNPDPEPPFGTADFSYTQRASTVILPRNPGSKLPVTLPQMFTATVPVTGSILSPNDLIDNTTLHVIPYVPFADPAVQIVLLGQRSFEQELGGFGFTIAIVIGTSVYYSFGEAPEGISVSGTSTTSTCMVDVRFSIGSYVSSPVGLVSIWPIIYTADSNVYFSQPSVKLTTAATLGLTTSTPSIAVTSVARNSTYTPRP